MIGQDSTAALVAGTIDARSDSHVSRTPLVLDEKGWSELNALLGETLERAIEIQEESASRLGKDEGIETKLSILHFESPAESK